MYYNNSGQAKCFNTSQQAVSALGDEGWYFQVGTRAVYATFRPSHSTVFFGRARTKFISEKDCIEYLISIFECSIIHFVCPSPLPLPHKFCVTTVFKCSWGHFIFPRAFENNSLCKIWGANKVYYGAFETKQRWRRPSCCYHLETSA